MARKKNYRPLIALAALAVAALALATMTFTNVTEWVITATVPPAMKYAGADATSSGTTQYVQVSTYYDNSKGYNVTRISIVGFTGDPTNYTEVLKLCNNAYSGTLYAKLVAGGLLGGINASAIKDFRVYFYKEGTTAGTPHKYSEDGYYIQYIGQQAQVPETTSAVPIEQGKCAIVGAYVVVDATLPSSQYRQVLAQYEVNIVFSTSP